MAMLHDQSESSTLETPLRTADVRAQIEYKRIHGTLLHTNILLL